jgi:hypothetical protein
MHRGTPVTWHAIGAAAIPEPVAAAWYTSTHRGSESTRAALDPVGDRTVEVLLDARCPNIGRADGFSAQILLRSNRIEAARFLPEGPWASCGPGGLMRESVFTRSAITALLRCVPPASDRCAPRHLHRDGTVDAASPARSSPTVIVKASAPRTRPCARRPWSSRRLQGDERQHGDASCPTDPVAERGRLHGRQRRHGQRPVGTTYY